MDKIRRITAMLTVIVIIALIIGTLVCAITGSEYFFGMLALMLLVPIILWVFNWFAKLTSGNDSSQMQEDADFMEEE